MNRLNVTGPQGIPCIQFLPNKARILPQYRRGVSHSTAGNKTPWVRPGLPDCCDWRPVGGALVQSPQQRRSVLSPLKQGNFCRVCGVGEDRMRSLVCRRRATGHFPTHGDAGRLSVWLNQHQTKWPASQPARVRVRVSSCTSGNFHFPPTTDGSLSVCPSLLFLPEAVEQVEHKLLAEKPSIPPVHALQTQRTVP